MSKFSLPIPRPESTRWLVVAIALLAALLGLSGFAARLQVDNRIEQWLVQSPETAKHYAEFRERFGSDLANKAVALVFFNPSLRSRSVFSTSSLKTRFE